MRSSPSKADPLDPGPAGYAHRGLHSPGVPENSLAAFEAALEMGIGIECDVRLSRDGSAVVFHDGSLKRLCGIALETEQTPAALLTGQRLSSSSQYIPTLWQLLEVVNRRAPLLIELKTRNGNAASICAEILLDLAPESGAFGVMSFDPRVGRWFRKNAPHVRRGLVIRDDLAAPKRWFAMFVAAPQFLSVDRKALGKSWVARARKRMPVYSWTIRTAHERAQAAVHADALIWEGDGRPRN